MNIAGEIVSFKSGLRKMEAVCSGLLSAKDEMVSISVVDNALIERLQKLHHTIKSSIEVFDAKMNSVMITAAVSEPLAIEYLHSYSEHFEALCNELEEIVVQLNDGIERVITSTVSNQAQRMG